MTHKLCVQMLLKSAFTFQDLVSKQSGWPYSLAHHGKIAYIPAQNKTSSYRASERKQRPFAKAKRATGYKMKTIPNNRATIAPEEVAYV